MKNQKSLKLVCGLVALSSLFLSGCRFDKVKEDTPPELADLDKRPEREFEVEVKSNPHKHMPMDFRQASEVSQENRTFPGPFRIAADNIEIGRTPDGSSIPNVGAHGGAYLEMPHPDGSLLHIRGSRIRSHEGVVTVSGWPVVVRGGKRLVATTKDTVIKIGSRGVEALGPSEVEDLVSSATSGFASNDGSSNNPPMPFVPPPPEPAYPKPEPKVQPKPETPTVGSTTTAGTEEPKRRGIINGKPLNRPEKRGFSGTYPGTDNPKLPGDSSTTSLNIDIDKSPSRASADLGVPPLSIPKP